MLCYVIVLNVVGLGLGVATGPGEIVNDVTRLNPVPVQRVVQPKTIEEIQALVRNHKGFISVGGGRFSMGGQTATENALQIDTRAFNRILHINREAKKVTVQAGARWREIQEAVDPLNLSVKIMQTYSNFTVGGSLSVNVHGRYVGEGPVIRSVDSFKIILADGKLVEATPRQNSEIFFAAIGGYGALGVIVEATLQLVQNEKVERNVRRLPVEEYVDYFSKHIRNNPKVVFHNGDLYPPAFTTVNAVSWVRTDQALTIRERLIPRNRRYSFQPRAISFLNSAPKGRELRSSVIDPIMDTKKIVCWRNYEASYDVAELEPPSREKTTFVLQEYFVPVGRFYEFIPKMRTIFERHHVKVFNVSIRHALPDTGSVLSWAPEEVFAFVVYYEQGVKQEDREEVARWTRELIAAAIDSGGRYYLPYQIHATPEQFEKAYSRSREFFRIKKKFDPANKFRNKLWDAYAPYSKLADNIPN